MELFFYNKRVKVSLLILAYNEESFIEEVVKKYNHYFASLIVVNDCSTDNTSTILSDLSESNKNIVIINNQKNVGAGKSMFNGVEYFLESESDYLIKIDGDDQFIEKDIVFLLEKIKVQFELEEKNAIYSPTHRHNFSMYIGGKWYSLTAKKGSYNEDDIVENLDARILTKNILTPILDIVDLKTDNRIAFMEGTKGAKGLQEKVDSEEAIVAFGLFPVSIEQLKAVADANDIMPPKSTWIEPKMRSGLTIYSLDD